MTPASAIPRSAEFALASLLTAYPDDDIEPALAGVPDGVPADAALSTVRRALRQADGLDDLRSRYVELFDRGGNRASLYESEYGRMRGMGKGNTLADVAGFYHAFGVGLDEDRHELMDHLAVELEFYSVLLLKQAALSDLGDVEGGEIVLDARRKFMAEHLGGLARSVADRDEVRADPVYSTVFSFCSELVREECAALGVEPAPLDFFADEEAKKEMQCGHLPVIRD